MIGQILLYFHIAEEFYLSCSSIILWPVQKLIFHTT